MAKIVITLEDVGAADEATVEQTVDVSGFDVNQQDVTAAKLPPSLLIGGIMIRVSQQLSDQGPSEVPTSRSIN